MTGETENGRSISVMSTLLPGKLELRDRPRRGDAEDEVERHRDRGGEQRQLDRGERVRLDDRREVDVEAFLQAPRRRRTTSGTNRKTREEGERECRSAHPAQRLPDAAAIVARPALTTVRPAACASTPAAR